MIRIRRSSDRGHANHGWLDTYHTFSFADYYDPEFDGFRSLRVINEDKVAPANGFGTHPHRDMEIITYVLEGSVEHKDNMGNGSVIRPGDVQRMSAGTGVTHSEFNPSKTQTLHLLQIWIFPDKKNYEPSYEQKNFDKAAKLNKLCLVASGHPRNDSVTIHQDADLYVSFIEKGKTLEYKMTRKRYAWAQITQGSIKINGELLKQGDGAAISDEKVLTITGEADSEFLLFDLG